MIVFRLTRREFSLDLSGIGAEKLGGRWNSRGNSVLYTASNRALCLTEWLVHTPSVWLPTDLVMVQIEIPDSAAIHQFQELPKDWYHFPHPLSSRKLGDEWLLKSETLVLSVPSAVVPEEFNYLINPKHPEMKEVRILSSVDFRLDERFMTA